MCLHLLFKFGDWFSHFSSEDDWRQTVKSLYHFGNGSYVLMSLAYIFRLQPLEVFGKASIRLQECSYILKSLIEAYKMNLYGMLELYVECGK